MAVQTHDTDTAHPRFARLYPRVAARADERGAAEHRRRLLDGLAGRVVEIGAGHGGTFAHYPPAVGEVVAVEPEPTLRALAVEAARHAPVRVTVVAGVADALPVADGAFDAAVTSLVLCSVPDQASALAEVRRVLRPGGELRFYEHVLPRPGPLRWLSRVADRSGAWPALAAGCHLSRDTGAAIAAAGFAIERCESLRFSSAPLEPRLTFILGRARRP